MAGGDKKFQLAFFYPPFNLAEKIILSYRGNGGR